MSKIVVRNRYSINVPEVLYFLDALASLDFNLSLSESYFFLISDISKTIKIINDNQ